MMSKKAVDRVCGRFEAQFGSPPTFVVRAPGRVNLIGEHTDYNGGKVLPMAIDRYTYVAAKRAESELTRVRSSLKDDVVHLDRDFNPVGDHGAWISYIRGVLSLWPHPLGPLDVLVDSDVPMGAGLSSSAALEVATLKLAEAVSEKSVSILEAARLCQKAENDFAGVPCGIMDQMASLAGKEGHGVLLDCRTMERILVPLDQTSLAFVIIDSRESHQLVDGAYAERRQLCEEVAAHFAVENLCELKAVDLDRARDSLSPLLYRRAHHVVTENERVDDFVKALAAKDFLKAGSVLYQSHDSLRDSFEVSTPSLDLLVSLARSIGEEGGVYGCRLTGGGFGGSVILLASPSQAESAGTRLATRYQEMTGLALAPLIVRPSAGAEILRI